MRRLTRRAALRAGGAAALGLGGAWAVDATADWREAMALAAFPPEGRVVEVGGRPVHAVQRGQGPDLVLLHGALGSSRDMTFGLVDRLAARYRVTAFDRPGAGHTGRAGPAFEGAWSGRGEAPAEQAAMLRAAAPLFGVERPIVLGHSFGASVAMAWALADPQGTAGLVSVAGITVPWDGEDNLLFRLNGSRLGGALLVPLESAFAPEEATRRALRAVFEPDPVPQGYAEWVGSPLSLRRDALRAAARQVLALRPALREAAPLYRALQMPLEIVQGDADPITRGLEQSDGLMVLVPRAGREVLPGLGHMPHHAAADAVARAVDRVRAKAA